MVVVAEEAFVNRDWTVNVSQALLDVRMANPTETVSRLAYQTPTQRIMAASTPIEAVRVVRKKLLAFWAGEGDRVCRITRGRFQRVCGNGGVGTLDSGRDPIEEEAQHPGACRLCTGGDHGSKGETAQGNRRHAAHRH
jgi:hypothetical protein